MEVNSEDVQALTKKFADAANGKMNTVILTATSLFLAEFIAREELTLQSKLHLIDDFTAAMKRFVRSTEDN